MVVGLEFVLTQALVARLRDDRHRLLERYQDLYPSTMKSFTDDLEACWAHFRCLTIHQKRIRTTNLLEIAFGEQKQRTKVNSQDL